MMRHVNKLVSEKSPYLLQHAYNPVDWYPWCQEAFEKAQAEDKPIFLSIGYATCHWCHVMEHESFEDEEVARLMNSAFVSIKVDREERPDVDHAYMNVCLMINGSGGWPLTILMTPQKQPFYAGTYIPKEGRFGRPGMKQMIPQIQQLWQNEREKVLKSAQEIASHAKRSGKLSKEAALDKSVFHNAFNQFSQKFDSRKGGFGKRPKFPSPHNFLFLLRYWHQNNSQKAIDMVTKTLTEMRYGGIFDHVGYGFHRYSTDPEWLVPHFEKMLYDQAMLVCAYTEAFQSTKDPLFKKTVEEVCQYVLRDMTHEEGGFFSAEDADSEGVEGKFYVWSEEEVRNLLPANQAQLYLSVYNFKKSGNFAEEASGEFTGSNIPHIKKSYQEIAQEQGMSLEELNNELESIRQQLFEVREKRIHPLKDDKVLTDWNGLMIAALAKAGRALNNQTYIDAATKAYAFIKKNLRDSNALLHMYRDGESRIMAHADDYAFVVWGLLELYQATQDPELLEEALELNDTFIENCWDPEEGGFFFSSSEAEQILHRNKEMYDGAIPSGNSIAMYNLLRLGRITGRSDLEEKAEELHKLFAGQARGIPMGFSQFLVGLQFGLEESSELVVVGSKEEAKDMLQEANSNYQPNLLLVFKNTEDPERLERVVPFAREHNQIEGRTTAYFCKNYQCEQPVTEVSKLSELLLKT